MILLIALCIGLLIDFLTTGEGYSSVADDEEWMYDW